VKHKKKVKKMFEKEKEISEILGIKFKTMPTYKAELVNLRNDGYTIKQIANLLNEPVSKAYHWFQDVQPRSDVIQKLENLYFKRQK